MKQRRLWYAKYMLSKQPHKRIYNFQKINEFNKISNTVKEI